MFASLALKFEFGLNSIWQTGHVPGSELPLPSQCMGHIKAEVYSSPDLSTSEEVFVELVHDIAIRAMIITIELVVLSIDFI